VLQILQDAFVNQNNFCGLYAVVIDLITSEERLAVELALDWRVLENDEVRFKRQPSTKSCHSCVGQ